MQSAPHILIVDDHREFRDRVSGVLTKEGFRVRFPSITCTRHNPS